MWWGEKRLINKTLRDSQLSLQWLPCKEQRSQVNEESASIDKKQQNLEKFYEDFYSWLVTLDEILHEK